MRLTATKVEIENFAAVAARQTLLLDGTGLHFLKGKNLHGPRLGSNGATKSTIWNAATWSLFGRTLDGLRSTDIEPWRGDKHTCVAFHFRAGERSACVVRSTHPNRLTINDKPAAQEDIDRLLGLSFETWRNAVMLGQGRPLFFDLTPEQKMKLFADVLQLARWDQRSKNASKAADAVSATIDNWTLRKSTAESEQKTLRELLERVSRDHDQWEIERAKQELAAKADRKKLEAELAKLLDQQSKYDLEYDGAMTEVKHHRREHAELTELLQFTTAELTKHEANCKAFKIEAARLSVDLGALGKNVGTCPLCGQSTKGTAALDKHRTELVERIRTAEKASKTKPPKAALAAVDDCKRQLAQSAQHLAAFQTKADKARDARDTFNGQVANAKAALARVQPPSEENPHTRTLNDLRKRARGVKLLIMQAADEIKLHSRRLEHVEFWVKGFREIKLQVIEDVLQELDIATNAMLDDFGLEGWQVRYNVEKETQAGGVQRVLGVTVYSPDNDKLVRFQCFSGGEGQRLRIVGALALADVLLNHAGVQSTLEVLDEPTRGLSTEGVADLCDFLADRARQLGKSIFLVDHKAIESSAFTDVITVTRGQQGPVIQQ